MTIIFNYLFTPAGDEFTTRVPIRIQQGPLLQRGKKLVSTDLNGLDLRQWEGKNLAVTVSEGIYSIDGLADR